MPGSVPVTGKNYHNVVQKMRLLSRGNVRQEGRMKRTTADVKTRGDRTVLNYTKPFDGPRLTKRQLRVIELTFIVEGTRQGVELTLRPLKALATVEGLPNRYASAESRFAR